MLAQESRYGRYGWNGAGSTVWRLLPLVLAILMVAQPAEAANVTYKNGPAPLNVYATSGIATIKGGKITSTCVPCGVEIRTTLSFYPYYVHASASANWYVTLTHSAQSSMRSRCRHTTFDDNLPITCYYTTP